MLTLLAASAASALSIFDVIQLSENGYTDRQIIDLMEATGSVFELEAQDLPKLKQLGVDETVIRAMLERAPEESSGGEPGTDSSPGSRRRSEHEQPRDEHAPVVEAAPVASRAGTPSVSFQPAEEELSGGHLHMAMTLGGLEVLILRDEGSFPTVRARAREVAHRLTTVLTLDGGCCFLDSAGERGPAVVSQESASGERITILEVTAADAHAYQLRSGRRVSRELLAAYWADLLSDYLALAQGRPPERTLALHDGDALGVLHQALRSSGVRAGDLRGAAELLPQSVRHHLERMTAVIPVDYDR